MADLIGLEFERELMTLISSEFSHELGGKYFLGRYHFLQVTISLVPLKGIGAGIAIIKGPRKDSQGSSSRPIGRVGMGMFSWNLLIGNVSGFLAREFGRTER